MAPVCKTTIMSFKKLRQMIELKGNGNIVPTETRVNSFSRLHLSVKGDIELVQSGEEKVVVIADENLRKFFEIVNSGSILYVISEAKLWSPVFTYLKVIVHFNDLDTIYNSSSGTFTTPSQINFTHPLEIKLNAQGNTHLHINAPSLKVQASCEGNVSLKGNCQLLDIRNQSVGDMDLSEMQAGVVHLNNSGKGNIRIHCNESISIRHNGHGDIYYSGGGALKELWQNGTGEVLPVQPE